MSAYDRVPDELKKIDLLENGDAERLVKEHKKIEKHLVPLRINAITVIYVPKKKQNEGYRKQWMKRHGMIVEDKKPVVQKKTRVKNVDLMFVKTKLYDGYPLMDVAAEQKISSKYLRERLRREGIHVPTQIEIIDMLKKRGMKIDEIVERTGLRKSYVHNRYNME